MKKIIIAKGDILIGLVFFLALAMGVLSWTKAAFPAETAPEPAADKAVESPAENSSLEGIFQDIAFLIEFLEHAGNENTKNIIASGGLDLPATIEIQEKDAGGIEYIKLIWVNQAAPEKE